MFSHKAPKVVSCCKRMTKHLAQPRMSSNDDETHFSGIQTFTACLRCRFSTNYSTHSAHHHLQPLRPAVLVEEQHQGGDGGPVFTGKRGGGWECLHGSCLLCPVLDTVNMTSEGLNLAARAIIGLHCCLKGQQVTG